MTGEEVDRVQDLLDKLEDIKKISFKEPALAFEMADQIRLEALSKGHKGIEASALFTKALACRSMTKLSACFDHVSDALTIFETLGDNQGIAGSLNLIGVVYYYYAMYDQALAFFLKAELVLKTLDDYVITSRLYNNMGEVYREVENYDASLHAYQKALLICEAHNFAYNAAVIMENIGEVLYRLGNFDESLSYYTKSYAILENTHDLTALAELENRIGKIHLQKKEYESARAYFGSALERLESLGNKYFSIDVLINFAMLERLFDPELFVHYLNRGIVYGEALGARKKLSQIFQMFADYYESQKSFEEALEYYKRYHRMEQLIETTVIADKLEIIKIEISKLDSGNERDKINALNQQLEQNIEQQEKMLDSLEQTNKLLNVQVITDELTAIYNRRGLKQAFAEYWFNHEQSPFNCSLFMIDIDKFKRFNDCHGHAEGDACLKTIAKTLKEKFEGYQGVIGRIGGEEFTCFALLDTLEEAHVLAETLRIAVEALDITYVWQGESYPITISIGLCFGNSSKFEGLNELYRLADQELYRAKEFGRNCIFTTTR